MEKTVRDKLKIHGYDVFQSLGKSENRAIILISLKLSGGKATIAELSEHTGISYTNIRRAVFGHGHSKSRSLISTSLAIEETVSGTNTPIIALTTKGNEVARTLEDIGFNGKTICL